MANNGKDVKAIVNIDILLKRSGKDIVVDFLDELLLWADADLKELQDFDNASGEMENNIYRRFKLNMTIRTHTEEVDSDDTERGTRKGS